MITKKQHFVPKLLLRRFATWDREQARVNVYDIKRNQIRKSQNIDDVCAGNYTYDKDNSFESFLGKNIETPAGEEISRILNGSISFIEKPDPKLLQFVLVQLLRTRQAYESNLEFLNSMMKTVLVETARLNNWDEQSAAQLRLEPDEPRVVLSYLAAAAAMQFPLIADLAGHIVTNETDEEFITSDHPVFQHNWYLRDSPELLANSITARGVQFFLPLSPSKTLCLYDASVYAYRGKTRDEPILVSRDDVLILNSFQALNADSLLLTRSDRMLDSVKVLGQQYANRKAYTSSATNTQPVDKGDGELRSTHITRRIQTRVSSMPSFVKVKNKIRRKALDCSHRLPDLVFAMEVMEAERRKEREQQGDE